MTSDANLKRHERQTWLAGQEVDDPRASGVVRGQLRARVTQRLGQRLRESGRRFGVRIGRAEDGFKRIHGGGKNPAFDLVPLGQSGDLHGVFDRVIEGAQLIDEAQLDRLAPV